MAHDAAHRVTRINSAPACRAGKDISLTVSAHVSAPDCSSTQGALLQSRRHGEKANSIVSTQYQIPTPGPSSGVLPWPQAGSLGCGCSTRRSSSVTTDKLTNRGLCGRRQAASLPSLLWQNWLKIAELEGCGADHPLVCTLRGQRALWFSELSLCFRGQIACTPGWAATVESLVPLGALREPGTSSSPLHSNLHCAALCFLSEAH